MEARRGRDAATRLDAQHESATGRRRSEPLARSGTPEIPTGGQLTEVGELGSAWARHAERASRDKSS